MPTYTSGGASGGPPSSGLPRSVEDYLRSGAVEGSRNRTLFAAATQLRDIDAPLDEALHLLIPRATQDGLSASEATSCIESAFRGPKREAPVGKSGIRPPQGEDHGDRRTKGVYRIGKRGDDRSRWSGDAGSSSTRGSAWDRATNVPLPERIEEGFEELLLAAFEEGEGVCVGGTFVNEDGEIKPDAGVTLSREQWIEKVRQKGGDFSRMHTSRSGHYIRVNPMRIAAGSRHSDADVSAFRHVLVEFDLDGAGKPIKKDRQLGAILASNLPVTAIIDSGGKSVHAWVRVDASTIEEYKARVEEVYDLFGGDIDSANSNPSRYSRCPDGIRTVVDGESSQEVRQALLATNRGTGSWEEWKKRQAAQSLGEPWTALRDFENYDVENDPNTILGNRWICRGGSLVLVSQSGVGKSSLQMQLKIGWSLGRDDMTFGIRPIRPLKQLTLQAENDQGDVAEAWRDVTNGHGLSYSEKAAASSMCLWHRVTTLVGDAFLDTVESLVQLHKPDICWIDPLLNYIGDDVSKAEVISHFCVEGLSAIALRTGVVFAIIHHAGKPKDQRTREAMNASDLAYMGLGSSALTNWAREVMVLSRVKTESSEDPPTFSLTATKRRTRAGMKSMPIDGDPLEVKITAEIFIRHGSDGRIRWEQCPEPSKAERNEGRGRRKPKSTADEDGAPGGKRSPGRPSTLSADQKREIVRIAAENGGRLPANARTQLAAKFSKSPKTIQNYLERLEQSAALSGGSVQGALAEDLGDEDGSAEPETRLPYKD